MVASTRACRSLNVSQSRGQRVVFLVACMAFGAHAALAQAPVGVAASSPAPDRAAAEVLAAPGSVEVAQAVVQRFEEKQVVDLDRYLDVRDAVRDLKRHAAATGRVGGTPTQRVYVIQAKTEAGKRVELTQVGGLAPRRGQTLSYDPKTMEVAR